MCENDEIIEIKYLYFDNLLKNYSIIYNQSLKYNIIDKINNFENIIDINISNKNLIIITSVLNISKNNSYYSVEVFLIFMKDINKHLKR